MIWPADVAIPPPPARGRLRDIPVGDDEGLPCHRQHGDGTICLGRIDLKFSDPTGCCSCHRFAPCAYCLTTALECPRCGWRNE